MTAAEVFKTLGKNADIARHVTETIIEDLYTATHSGDLLAESAGSMKFSIMPRSETQKPEDRKTLAYVLPEYFSD